MSKVLVSDSYLTDIANAIRAKLSTSVQYTPSQMAGAIESISGGGTPSIVVGYPIHNDGNTHIYIDVPSGLLTMTLSLKVKGSTSAGGSASIDFGDGRRPTAITSSGTSIQTISVDVSYTSPGIKHIQIVAGSNTTLYFYGGTSYGNVSCSAILCHRTSGNIDAMSQACLNCIRSIETNFALNTGAFRKCQGLEQLVIYNQVSTASSMCEESFPLPTVILPTSLATISSKTFYNCGLSSIVIPSNVTSILTYAFANCTNLAEIHFTSANPPQVTSSTTFGNLPTMCKIYVPIDSLEDYISASNYPSSATYEYIGE